MADRPHKKLKVWQHAVELVTMVYELTKNFPSSEEYGLKSQMRRAAISVPSNIAEGLARRKSNDKLHFLNISQSSLSELDTQVEISTRLGLLEEPVKEAVESKIVDVQMLLSGLIRSMR